MQKKISFTNSKGDKLVGILTQPKDSQNRPLVILVHGFRSNKNSPIISMLSEMLADDGIATLRIDIFGHGESDGKFEDITVTEAVDDILQAINYAKEIGYQRVGLIGSSFGGLSSILTAAKNKNLIFLGLKSPVSDWESIWKKIKTPEELHEWKLKGITDYEGYKLRYTAYENHKENNAYDVASSITAPTLIIHGNKDSMVPLTQSEKLVQLIPNAKLRIVKNADHWYKGDGEKEKFLQAMHEFVLRHV